MHCIDCEIRASFKACLNFVRPDSKEDFRDSFSVIVRNVAGYATEGNRRRERERAQKEANKNLQKENSNWLLFHKSSAIRHDLILFRITLFYTIKVFPNFAAMKARDIMIVLAGMILVPVYFGSCAVDRWAAYAEETQTDRWIDDTMRVWYYWNQDIPNTNQLNYFSEPFSFFASLLSDKDGKGGQHYSTIDSLTYATRSIPYTDHSYGFQFTTNRVEGNDTALYAHILYVTPESPAGEIGLRRGDWIMEMNGEPITQKNYERLYGSEGMQLTIGYYDAKNDTILSYAEPQIIAPARHVNDHPVHYHNVYQQESKKIGYLVYNHFSSGTTDNDNEYDRELRATFREFAAQQVNEFILDLRYNNGGLITCAQLLCAMLAPSSALGQQLGYLEYNQNFSPVDFYLDENLIQDGANLNLSTLYVLTSAETASASEMLINCLRPYMRVILIGETTEGKNVGSISFTNPELMLTMSPIVCKIYNSLGESDYENGFSADESVNENSDMARFLPFGDTNELLLNTALGLISGNLPAPTSSQSGLQTTVLHNSVKRRASQAVQIEK